MIRRFRSSGPRRKACSSTTAAQDIGRMSRSRKTAWLRRRHSGAGPSRQVDSRRRTFRVLADERNALRDTAARRDRHDPLTRTTVPDTRLPGVTCPCSEGKMTLRCGEHHALSKSDAPSRGELCVVLRQSRVRLRDSSHQGMRLSLADRSSDYSTLRRMRLRGARVTMLYARAGSHSMRTFSMESVRQSAASRPTKAATTKKRQVASGPSVIRLKPGRLRRLGWLFGFGR